MSSRGVAVGLNILYHRGDGRGELGVPVHLVLRRLLGEAASVDDAWACCARRRSRPPAASRSSTRAATAPASSSHPRACAGSSPRDGLLAHTNHFLDAALARDEGEQPADWLPGSRARLAAARARCAARAGRRASALRAVHDDDPQAICRHDEPSGEPNRPLVGTVVSLAMRPGVPELRVAAGSAVRARFVRYEL